MTGHMKTMPDFKLKLTESISINCLAII